MFGEVHPSVLCTFLKAIHSGIYCLLAVATMLNLMTPELLAGTPEFIATCQTYEGGFGNASFPDWALGDDPTAPRPPLGEAHGGYTFCATASWVLLQPYIKMHYPAQSLPPPTIDYMMLLRWCTQMQGSDIELGGFRGRTNKLVDGCYSWWIGGCVILVEGLLGIGQSGKEQHDTAKDGEDEHGWDDVDGAFTYCTSTFSLTIPADSLFNRIALQEYVLYAGQHTAGGLVDKPPKYVIALLRVPHSLTACTHRNPDAYHTLYCLSGLSSAQHRVVPNDDRRKQLSDAWKDSPEPGTPPLSCT